MQRSMMRHCRAMLAVWLCVGCAPAIDVSPPTLMSGAQAARGQRGTTDTFTLNDRIIQIVDITWADASADGGIHSCEWKWFRGAQLVSDSGVRDLAFRRTPVTLHSARPAAPFGIGHYTVEMLLDGRTVATSAFTITD